MTLAPAAKDIRIETPQGRLFARVWGEFGERSPIILLHDSLGAVELWRDFPEKLAAASGRPVVAYDRLGFGRSDPNPELLQRDFVHDEAYLGLSPLRQALGIDRMILFGHSVGGGMAVAAAAAFPEATQALITESAQAFVEDRTIAGIQEAKIAFAQPGQVERLARYHGDKARWVLDAWIETWLAPSFADWTLDEDAARVRCPVLALHGDGDEFGSAEHPRRIVGDRTSPSRALILEGCGHVPHREKPELILETVTGFLAETVGD